MGVLTKFVEKIGKFAIWEPREKLAGKYKKISNQDPKKYVDALWTLIYHGIKLRDM